MMSLQKVEQYADRLTEDQSKKAWEGTQGKKPRTFIQDQVTRWKWGNQRKAEVV